MKIKLEKQNKYLLIDDGDVDLVKDFKWYLLKTAKKEYATAGARIIDGQMTHLLTISESAKKRRTFSSRSKFNNDKIYKNPVKKILLHRLIMDFPKNMEIDHINGNGLDNRRENLRICTRMENGRNRKLSSLNTSGYHGVTFSKSEKRRKRWLTNIRINGKRKYLGRFFTKEEAALVYNQAAKKYHGKFATLNELCKVDVSKEVK